MVYLFCYLGVFVLWIITELLTAPKGWEDENGFHLGEPDRSSKGVGESDSLS
jgi:hypothetical protein